MKKWTIIVSKDTNNKITANIYDKDNLNSQESMILPMILQTATLVAYDTSPNHLTSNTMYYYENDNIDYAEYFFRNMGARKCDSCGKWINPQDIDTSVYEGNNIRYCAICATNRPKELKVHGYHETSDELKFLQLENETMTAQTFKGLGIEMEIDRSTTSMVRGGKIKCTDAFFKHARGSNKVWRLEHDGSLNYGVEFISNCMSFAYAKAYNWNILTDQMKHLECEDNMSTSGFHVHVSKLCLGDDEKTQAINTLKLMYFMAIYQDDFLRVCGRNINEMSYCRFLTESEVTRYKTSLLSRENSFFYVLPSNHAYCIINSRNTIEIRIFKSTSDAEKIKHTLALIMGIVENIDKVPFEKIYCFKRMFKLVPEETLKYWRSKGAFLRTHATIKKGETL